MGTISTRADRFVRRVMQKQPTQIVPEKTEPVIAPQRQAREIMGELARRRKALLARRGGL
jgi:hypothetical protein